MIRIQWLGSIALRGCKENKQLQQYCLVQQKCWAQRKAFFSKKRKAGRFLQEMGSGRMKRRGLENFNYQDSKTKISRMNHNEPLSLGWKPIAFLLLAPPMVGLAIYSTRSTEEQKKLRIGLGFVE